MKRAEYPKVSEMRLVLEGQQVLSTAEPMSEYFFMVHVYHISFHSHIDQPRLICVLAAWTVPQWTQTSRGLLGSDFISFESVLRSKMDHMVVFILVLWGISISVFRDSWCNSHLL